MCTLSHTLSQTHANTHQQEDLLRIAGDTLFALWRIRRRLWEEVLQGPVAGAGVDGVEDLLVAPEGQGIGMAE